MAILGHPSSHCPFEPVWRGDKLYKNALHRHEERPTEQLHYKHMEPAVPGVYSVQQSTYYTSDSFAGSRLCLPNTLHSLKVHPTLRHSLRMNAFTDSLCIGSLPIPT